MLVLLNAISFVDNKTDRIQVELDWTDVPVLIMQISSIALFVNA